MRRAFTLIELLVVISIIALLIAILLPALGRVRVVAKEAICASQQHQIYIGKAGFSVDNKGELPSMEGAGANSALNVWDKAVSEEVITQYASGSDETFYCPLWLDNNTFNTPGNNTVAYWWEHWTPYGYPERLTVSYYYMNNERLNPDNFLSTITKDNKNLRVQSLEDRSDLAILSDTVIASAPGVFTGWNRAHWSAKNLLPTGSNVTYIDGSTQNKPYSELEVMYSYRPDRLLHW